MFGDNHLEGSGSSPLKDSMHPPLKKQVKIPIIVLDPGHGGEDFGAVSESGLKEKEVALDIALRTREYLEYLGFTVILTRSDDRFVSLEERARIRRESDADLFVSIHANAAANKDATGFETFLLSPHKGANGIEKYGFLTYFALSSVGKRSLSLARIIQKEMAEKTGSFDRGVKMAKFRVLKETHVPGVLVETGFLTNRGEAAALASQDYRSKVALALAKSVQRFKIR